jgi:hypothetical protein
MRSKFGLLICITALFASASFAQSANQDVPATREDVVKMLDALHTKETMKIVMETMAQQAKDATRRSIKRAHPQATEHDLAEGDRLMDQVIADMPLDEIIDSMIPIYQKHFTRQDMVNISAFYASPTGQKFVREMPAMAQESMQANMAIIEKRMAASQRKVQEMMDEIIERNRKSGEHKRSSEKS